MSATVKVRVWPDLRIASLQERVGRGFVRAARLCEDLQGRRDGGPLLYLVLQCWQRWFRGQEMCSCPLISDVGGSYRLFQTVLVSNFAFGTDRPILSRLVRLRVVKDKLVRGDPYQSSRRLPPDGFWARAVSSHSAWFVRIFCRLARACVEREFVEFIIGGATSLFAES